MGAWGAGAFENDDAADWVYELEASSDAEEVRRALDVSGSEHLEVGEGSIAIAAAEVVAAALGRGGPELPEGVASWVARHGSSLTASDAALATAAVERATGADSEARELWDEAGDDAWLRSNQELLRRLQGTTRS